MKNYAKFIVEGTLVWTLILFSFVSTPVLSLIGLIFIIFSIECLVDAILCGLFGRGLRLVQR